MDRHRQLEILCANAVLKAVSQRFAPGTPERVLQFLADRGAVSALIEQYHRSDDLEEMCLGYWNALLEPDGLRLEDLVSTILISFATSMAAGLVIEGGKAAFPVLYRRLVKEGSVERTLTEIAALEDRRRQHLTTLLALLNRKAAAVTNAQAALQQNLGQARAHLQAGESLADFVAAIPGSPARVDLTPIESVIRGVLLTEEQRETNFGLDRSPREGLIEGLPLSSFFGIGQIETARLPDFQETTGYWRAYDTIDQFVADIHAPLRAPLEHTYLKNLLGRPPRKILPVSDLDLSFLIDFPSAFMQCRPLLAGLVVDRGGMTSHTAVLSRGMGIPCIQVAEPAFGRLGDYQFMAIQEGKAQFFDTPPDRFHQFL